MLTLAIDLALNILGVDQDLEAIILIKHDTIVSPIVRIIGEGTLTPIDRVEEVSDADVRSFLTIVNTINVTLSGNGIDLERTNDVGLEVILTVELDLDSTLTLGAEECGTSDVGVHLTSVDEGISNMECGVSDDVLLLNISGPVILDPDEDIVEVRLEIAVSEDILSISGGVIVTVDDHSDRLHLVALESLTLSILDLTEEEAVLAILSIEIPSGQSILIIDKELDIEVTDLGDLLDILLAEVVDHRVNSLDHELATPCVILRIGDEGSVDIGYHLGTTSDRVILRCRHDVVTSALVAGGPHLSDVVAISGLDIDTLLKRSDRSGQQHVDIERSVVLADVAGDDGNILASILPEILRTELPNDHVGTLDRVHDRVADSTDGVTLRISGNNDSEAVIESVEVILAVLGRVVKLLVHVLNSGHEHVTLAVEVEYILASVVERIPSRNEVIGSVSILLDEDLDVSDVDDVLTVHELDTDDRSTADSGGTVDIVNGGLEDTILNLELIVVLNEVGLVGLRESDLVVLDNLILEVEAELFHLLVGHLEAVPIGTNPDTFQLVRNLLLTIVAALRQPAVVTTSKVVRNGDGLEIQSLGVSDSGVASGMGLIKGHGTLNPSLHIIIGEILVAPAIIVITSILTLIVAADTNGSSAVVLLVFIILEFSLLAFGSLHNIDRISDPRLGDILHNEGGIVGGVGLVTLGHLESELCHVVVLPSGGSGTALIGDTYGKNTILIALELGSHSEVLAALSPGVDRNILVDELVLIGLIKRSVIVDMVSGDSRNGLVNHVTILNRPLAIEILILRILKENSIPNPHITGELDLVLIDIVKPFLSGLLDISGPDLIDTVKILTSVDAGSEGLDLQGVDTVDNSLRDEHKAGGATVQLDNKLLLTAGDGQSVGVGVELDIEEAVRDD